MAYRIITDTKIFIQYTILDFIMRCLLEIIDCRTQEGIRRYKVLFRTHPPNRKRKNCPCNECNSPESDSNSSQTSAIRFIVNTFPERERRQVAGLLALREGRGGVLKASRLTGLDVKTVRKGREEVLNQEEFPKSRERRQGGGRHSKAQEEQRYEPTLRKVLEDKVAGDPMSDKKWTRKTLRWFKKASKPAGFTWPLARSGPR